MSDKHGIAKELEVSKRQWLKLTRDDQVFVAPVLSFTSFTLLAIGDKSLITHVLALVIMLLQHKLLQNLNLIYKRLAVLRQTLMLRPLRSKLKLVWFQ